MNREKKIKKKFYDIYKKVKSDEDIIKKLTNRNIKKRKYKFFLNISLIFGILAFIVYLFLPCSKINNIYVTGNNILSKDKIIDITNIKKEKNISLFTYNFFIKRKLLKNDFIKEVNICNTLYGEYYINIKERQIMFKTQINGEYFAFFGDGKRAIIKDDIKINTANLTTQENSINLAYEELAINLGFIPKEITEQISEIKHIPNNISNNRFLFFMKDKNRVVILLENIKEKFKYYNNLVDYTKDERYEFIMEYTKKGIIARKI